VLRRGLYSSASSPTKISVVYIDLFDSDRYAQRPASSSVLWVRPSVTIGHYSRFSLPDSMHGHQLANY
jgi:hypothetical protein